LKEQTLNFKNILYSYYDIFFCSLFLLFLFFLPVKVDIYNFVCIAYLTFLVFKNEFSFKYIYRDEFVVFIFLFWAVAIISSAYNSFSVNKSVDVLTAIFPYLLGRYLESKNIEKYLYCYVVIVLLTVIVCYFYRYDSLRMVNVAFLFFKNISRSSLFLSIGVLVSLFFCFRVKKKFFKIFYIVTILFLFYLVFILQELTPLVSLLGCSGLFLIKKKFKIYVVISIVVLFLLSIYFTHNKLKRLSDNPLSHITVNHRYNLWLAAFNMFKENPIIGHGYKSFKEKYRNYLDKRNRHYDSSVESAGYQDAHNISLQLLAETGILGFLTITFMFIYAFYLGMWKYSYDDFSFLIALIILLIYLNMQLHVHLDVNSVRGGMFLFLGLFKARIEYLKDGY